MKNETKYAVAYNPFEPEFIWYQKVRSTGRKGIEELAKNFIKWMNKGESCGKFYLAGTYSKLREGREEALRLLKRLEHEAEILDLSLDELD